MFRYPAYAAAKAAVGISCAARRLARRTRPSLLVYTDSRGFLIDRWYCRKNPFLGYAWELGKDFKVWDRICPHQHTTLIDFLFDFEQGRASGSIPEIDAIILHAGIVDFSPRPLSGAVRLRRRKAPRVERLFGREAVEELLATGSYPETFQGEPTASLYSTTFFAKRVIPAVEALPVPVVWVGTSRVLNGWRGTYFRDRPSNMNRILDYDRLIDGKAIHFCPTRSWTDGEIREFTVDNVHLSRAGFQLIGSWLQKDLALMGID